MTWYPGAWTNDYQFSPSAPDSALRDSTGHILTPTQFDSSLSWSSRQSFRWAPDSLNADLRLESSYMNGASLIKTNPNWRFSYRRSTNENNRPTGWEEAEYQSPVKDGDQVKLTLTSYDFAAGGDLSVGLARWVVVHVDTTLDTLNFQNFTPTRIIAINDTDSLNYLPIPRDMELIYHTFNFDVEGKPDSVVQLVQVGDRLGDAWELKPEFNYDNDIYKCDPYKDDSILDSSYFTEGVTPDSIYTFGDGLVNFEKYRGIYGVVESNVVIHKRMFPKNRNIFAESMEDPIIRGPGGLTLKGSTEYFNNISAAPHNVGDSLRIHTIQWTGDTLTSPYYRNIGLYNAESGKYDKDTLLYVSGVFRVNGRITNLPGEKIAPLVYIMNYMSMPDPIFREVGGANAAITVTGLTVNPKHSSLIPTHLMFCHSYYTAMFFFSGDYRRECQYHVQGHEMGHSVGHPWESPDLTSIMFKNTINDPHHWWNGEEYKRQDLVRFELTH